MGTDKIKIVAIVVNGDHKCYVLNRPLHLSYTKIDNETIIGEDEGVLSFFKRDYLVLPFGKTAFGGREFTLPLTDGTVEKCHGQWWDGMSASARELFDLNNLCYFAWSTNDKLKDCYVFYGCQCESQWLEGLESEYQGVSYGYWEYEKLIKERK